MSTGTDMANHEYVTDLYTPTTEVIAQDFVGSRLTLGLGSDSVCSVILGPHLSLCSSTPDFCAILQLRSYKLLIRSCQIYNTRTPAPYLNQDLYEYGHD